VDKSLRNSIRSGDKILLYATNQAGIKIQLATGFVDETDTHITANSLDYVISGRDTLGQLVDNSAVDAQNKIQNTDKVSLDFIIQQVLANTRMPPGFLKQSVPNGSLIWQTNPGETKINTLQRYLDIMNCLVWSAPDGRMIVGKPNFSQYSSGYLWISSSDPSDNNVLEARVKRNVNQAIRQIIVQLQTLDQVDGQSFTRKNQDKDVKALASFKVGRSVYQHFSYSGGSEAINQLTFVGNQTADPTNMGTSYALREIARENMKVLDIELVVDGHINSSGGIYGIDQMYDVFIEDEDLQESLYVYSCSYELSQNQGLLTRLRLCRPGTIVDGAPARRPT
jgi:prophage tail gpP-like protein